MLRGYVLKAHVSSQADTGHWPYGNIGCISFDRLTTANARSRTSDYSKRRLLIEDVYEGSAKNMPRKAALLAKGF